jgi:hypothetical protein
LKEKGEERKKSIPLTGGLSPFPSAIALTIGPFFLL